MSAALTLYDIGDELQRLQAVLDDPDMDEALKLGVIQEWLGRTDEGNKKLDDYAWLIRETKAKIEIAKNEQADWKAKREREEKRLADLERALLWFFDHTGRDFWDTRRFKLRKCAAGGTLPVIVECDPKALPAAYQRIKPAVVEADKEKIGAALSNGIEVPGCKFGERGHYPSIS